MNTAYLVGVALVAIVLLLVLVMKVKIPAFVALLAVAVLTALAAGIPAQEIIPTVIAGMGGTLGSVALLVGLGAMLGAIVEKTGGAEVLAEKFTARLGKDRVGPALLLASAIVAIPIFFDVAFIILVPIMFSFARAAGHRSPVYVGAPIAALMVFIHNTVPPHPGVTGSSTLLGADIGLVTIVGLLLAVPMGFLAYYTSKAITSRTRFDIDPIVQRNFDTAGADPTVVAAGTPVDRATGGPTGSVAGGTVGTPTGGLAVADVVTEGTTLTAARTTAVTRPGAGAVVAMILVPILMIAVGTISSIVLEPETTAANAVAMIGQPAFALLVAVILAMYVLGARHGWGRDDLGGIMESSLAPAAIVVFVTGAGGVFARVLTESGIGTSVSGALVGAGVPILLLAFLLASVFKVAQGSGTVATLATAGLLQATVTGGDFSSIQVVLLVMAIACGSLALSHINDSGFWIASRFLGLSVKGGLLTWTVLCTVLGWSTMVLVSLLWVVVS